MKSGRNKNAALLAWVLLAATHASAETSIRPGEKMGDFATRACNSPDNLERGRMALQLALQAELRKESKDTARVDNSRIPDAGAIADTARIGAPNSNLVRTGIVSSRKWGDLRVLHDERLAEAYSNAEKSRLVTIRCQVFAPVTVGRFSAQHVHMCFEFPPYVEGALGAASKCEGTNVSGRLVDKLRLTKQLEYPRFPARDFHKEGRSQNSAR